MDQYVQTQAIADRLKSILPKRYWHILHRFENTGWNFVAFREAMGAAPTLQWEGDGFIYAGDDAGRDVTAVLEAYYSLLA